MASATNLDPTSSQLALTSPADQKPPLLSLPPEVIMNIFDQLRNSPKDCAHLEMTCREILVISRDSHSTHWNIYPQHFLTLQYATSVNCLYPLNCNPKDREQNAINAAKNALMEKGLGSLTEQFLETLAVISDMVFINDPEQDEIQGDEDSITVEEDLIQEFYQRFAQERSILKFDQTDQLSYACQGAFHSIISTLSEKLIAAKSPAPTQKQLDKIHKFLRETIFKESLDAFSSQPLFFITRQDVVKKIDFLIHTHPFLHCTEIACENALRKSFQAHHSYDEVDDFIRDFQNKPDENNPHFIALKMRIQQKLINEKAQLEKELRLLRGPNHFDGQINEMHWKNVEEMKKPFSLPNDFSVAESSLVHRLRYIAIFDDSGAIVGGRLSEIENDLDDHVIQYKARVERKKLIQLFHELRWNNVEEWNIQARHLELAKILVQD